MKCEHWEELCEWGSYICSVRVVIAGGRRLPSPVKLGVSPFVEASEPSSLALLLVLAF